MGMAEQFQSTRPRGRTRPRRSNGRTTSRGFNPRVLAGGRDANQQRATDSGVVSIHASSREDATMSLNFFLTVICFNPRVLAGGRDTLVPSDFVLFMFQSTRPRGRTRRSTKDFVKACCVSIHASSREDATLSQIKRIGTAKFQSTRPRGRTRLCWVISKTGTKRFNPRVLAGGRDRPAPEN